MNVIRGLMIKFGINDVNILAQDRYRLSVGIEERIQQIRFAERKSAFQQFLLPDSPLVVREERSFNFNAINYDPSWYYEGSFQFKKHYYSARPGELQALTINGQVPEECVCAQFIDGMPEVKFWSVIWPAKSHLSVCKLQEIGFILIFFVSLMTGAFSLWNIRANIYMMPLTLKKKEL